MFAVLIAAISPPLRYTLPFATEMVVPVNTKRFSNDSTSRCNFRRGGVARRRERRDAHEKCPTGVDVMKRVS